MSFDPDEYLKKEKPKSGFDPDAYLKKKEETQQRDYSALSEQLGKRFENAGSTMQTTKSEEDLKAKKKRAQPELYRLAEESPEKFSSDEGREGVRTALLNQGYTSSEADIESERVQNLAIEKPIKDNTNRAKSYLKYVSGYGKDASIAKVANASDREIEEWTSQMQDKGISQQGIERAIHDYGNKYLSNIGEEEGLKYDIEAEDAAYKRVQQNAHEFERVTQEQVDAEKNEMLKSKLRDKLPEDLKIQAGIEDKVLVLINELRDKKESGTLTNAERDKYEAKLIGLEKLRNNRDYEGRLFDPVSGKLLGREDVTQSALDYEANVRQQMSELTDKEKTLSYAKKAMHRFEAMDDLYNSKVSFTMRDGRVITAPYSEIDSRYANIFDDDSESGRRIAEAKGIKNRWLKAKSQFEAVNRAYSTNTDPAQVDKGFFSYFSSVAEKSAEAFDSGELTTDTDIKFANEYVSLMDDLGSYVTPEQRETAKISFEEKLADATVTSAAIARDIAISALVTRHAGTLLGVGSKLGKIKKLMTTKWGKFGKHVYNISEEMVRGGVTFAPTDATFAEGAGEGFAQGSITALLGKRGKALGRLAEFGIRVTGGTATEVVQEYSGQLVNELTTSGVDVDEAFKRTFGRNIEDATDKLLLTATMSSIFSAGFNLNVLKKTRAVLQSELDEGNVPEHKIDDVMNVLKMTDTEGGIIMVKDGENNYEVSPLEMEEDLNDPDFIKDVAEGKLSISIDNNTELGEKLQEKIDKHNGVSVVKEEIKPTKDVPTKEKVKEEKEVTPIKDVKPVETGKEQETRGDGDTDTKQGEIEQTNTESSAVKKESTFEELTPEQNNRNALLDNISRFNKLSVAKKNSKQGKASRTEIINQARDLGFTLESNGEKLKAVNDSGKGIGKIPIKETIPEVNENEIHVAKELINQGVLIGYGVDGQTVEEIDLSPAEVRKGQADIESGNYTSKPAKRLVYALNNIKESGKYSATQQSFGKKRGAVIEVEPIKYTPEEEQIINEQSEESLAEFDESFNELTEEDKLQLLDNNERRNQQEASETIEQRQDEDTGRDEKKQAKETAKAKAELIAEANNLKEGEDTRGIMRKAKAAGLSKDTELLEIVSPKAKAYRQSQEKLQKATRDALGIEEDLNGDNIFLNEDVTDKLEEWKGEKLPKGKLKDAVVEVSKTGDISKGLDIMKDTDWYKDQSVEKQQEFEYDFQKSLGADMTGVEKPSAKVVFVRKSEAALIKDRINTLKQGITKGRSIEAKKLKELRNELSKYIKGTLKEFNLGKRSYDKMNTLIKNVNSKNWEESLEKVDSEFKKLESEDKTNTIVAIHDLLTNPKTIIGKEGERKVGKVPIEIQQYLKAFDTSNLNEMTRDQVKEIYADLKSVVNEGKKKTKSIKRALRAEKRRQQKDAFVEMHRTSGIRTKRKLKRELLKEKWIGKKKRVKEIIDEIKAIGNRSYKVSGKEAVLKELTENDVVAVINGQLITSQSKMKEAEKSEIDKGKAEQVETEVSAEEELEQFIEDNPGLDLKNVDIYEVEPSDFAEHNRGMSTWEKVMAFLNPIYSTANLQLNLTPLIKDSKILLEKVKEISYNIVRAENKLKKEVKIKKEELIKGFQDIYTKHNPGKKFVTKQAVMNFLSKEADIKVLKNTKNFSNSQIMGIYLMGKTAEGKRKLTELRGKKYDLEVVDKYVEANPELKEMAEHLSKWYNSVAKKSYADTYEKTTNTKFPEGTYYPLNVNKTFDALNDADLLDNNMNANPMKAFAGNMVARTKNNAPLDVLTGAFERAMTYIDTMERVKQFSEVSEEVSNVFTKATNSEIISKVGKRKFRGMIDHLTFAITGVDKANPKGDMKFINGLMALKVFNSLGWKTSSVPTQLTSFTHYSMGVEEVRGGQFWKGFITNTEEEKEVQQAFMWGDYVKDRFEGTSMDREYNNALNKGSGFFASIAKHGVKASMIFIKLGDVGAVMGGGSALAVAVYRVEMAKPGMTHEKAKAKAIEVAEIESELAQQSSLDSQTSYMQRNQVGRLFSSFKTSQIAAKNKMVISAKALTSRTELTPSQKRHHIANLLYFSNASLLFSVAKRGGQLTALGSIKALVLGKGDDEDEKNGLKFLYETTSDGAGSLLDGLGYSGFVLNVFVNSLTGNEWKNDIPIMQQMRDLFEGGAEVVKFITGDKEFGKLTKAKQKKIYTALVLSGFIKQIDSWVATAKGEKDPFEAFMNQRTPEEKKQDLQRSNDWLWYQMIGAPNKTNKTNRNKRRKRTTNK